MHSRNKPYTFLQKSTHLWPISPLSTKKQHPGRRTMRLAWVAFGLVKTLPKRQLTQDSQDDFLRILPVMWKKNLFFLASFKEGLCAFSIFSCNLCGITCERCIMHACMHSCSLPGHSSDLEHFFFSAMNLQIFAFSCNSCNAPDNYSLDCTWSVTPQLGCDVKL